MLEIEWLAEIKDSENWFRLFCRALRIVSRMNDDEVDDLHGIGRASPVLTENDSIISEIWIKLIKTILVSKQSVFLSFKNRSQLIVMVMMTYYVTASPSSPYVEFHTSHQRNKESSSNVSFIVMIMEFYSRLNDSP